MPVVIVAYSGGYLPAAYSLAVGGDGGRVRGLVLLDALYGERDKFVSWAEGPGRNAFFVSAYSTSSRAGNEAVRAALEAAGVAGEQPASSALAGRRRLRRRGLSRSQRLRHLGLGRRAAARHLLPHRRVVAEAGQSAKPEIRTVPRRSDERAERSSDHAWRVRRGAGLVGANARRVRAVGTARGREPTV